MDAFDKIKDDMNALGEFLVEAIRIATSAVDAHGCTCSGCMKDQDDLMELNQKIIQHATKAISET